MSTFVLKAADVQRNLEGYFLTLCPLGNNLTQYFELLPSRVSKLANATTGG